jgi:hypothetical protein
MPNPQTYGVAHVFGLLDTAQVYITNQSDNLDSTCAVDVKVMDSTGRVITVRKDDQHDTISFTGILKPQQDIPVAGTTAYYGGYYYIIDTVTDAGENSGFRKITVKATWYQEVDATPAP